MYTNSYPTAIGCDSKDVVAVCVADSLVEKHRLAVSTSEKVANTIYLHEAAVVRPNHFAAKLDSTPLGATVVPSDPSLPY